MEGSRHYFSQLAWDIFCVSTLVGIWPRYIEPNLLCVTPLSFSLNHLAKPLRIVQLSDLHIQARTSQKFLNKILRKIGLLKPDIIVITGDFLCNGHLEAPKLLLPFLKNLNTPLGLYAVLGNHDFEPSLTINSKGDYDANDENSFLISKGLKRLFSIPLLTKQVTEKARKSNPHPTLLQLLQEASVVYLENQTIQVNDRLNLTGMGEYMAGRANPEKAFKNYDTSIPGIVLAHNPDIFPLLKTYPCDIVLSGHSHGGQINFPWISRCFNNLENPQYKKGLIKEGFKSLYVSRGLGGVMPLRLNAIPELVSLDLFPSSLKNGI